MKKLLLIASALLPLFSAAQKKAALPSTYDVIIGTYTTGDSKGVYVYRLYEEKGRLSYLNEFTTTDDTAFTNPSYLTVSDNNRFIYAVNENKVGGVTALSFDPNTGKMKFINSQPSHGSSPCHIMVDKDQKNIFVANYSSGNLAVFPLGKDGSIGAMSQNIQDSGTGVNKERQEGPHVHMSVFSPNEKYLFYNDLGTDKINIMRYHASKVPPLTPADVPFVTVKPGNGPRHATFSPDGKFMYLLQEMGAAINVYSYDNGKLTQVQTISMLPDNFKGQVGAAAIHISPNGKFLYATDRGDDNDINVFSIDQVTGQLKFVSRNTSLGKGPRDFMIDPQGKFLIIANQYTNTVHVLRIEPSTGVLTGPLSTIQVGNPVCVKIVSAE
jgi:6-phosphogluconolactonase